MEINVRQFSSDKILKHLDRVNDWLADKNPPPITVELDMTNFCNHRCPECTGWNSKNKSRHSLPIELAVMIIKQLADARVRGIIFTGGGEPLCHPQTKEAVKLAHRLGLDIGFITNGSFINEEIGEALLSCCTWIRVSLDAASKGVFRKIHGLDGAAFDTVVKNVKLLTEMKKKLNSTATIGVGYLTCRDTFSGMRNMAVLSKRLGVDYLQYRPLWMHNNGKSGYCLRDINDKISGCLKESTDTYKVLYSKYKYEIMHDKSYGRNYKKCYGQQFATVVAADGKM